MLPVAAAFIASSALQVGSSIFAAYQNRQAANSEIKQYALQQEQIEQERANIANQYTIKRTQLIGSVNQIAGHNGVKVSGSLANSLNESLTQMNIEAAQTDYNLRMEKRTSALQQKNAETKKKYAYMNGFLQAGTTALNRYGTYNKYWGSNANTNKDIDSES